MTYLSHVYLRCRNVVLIHVFMQVTCNVLRHIALGSILDHIQKKSIRRSTEMVVAGAGFEPTTFVDRISPARFLWRRAPQLSSGHAFCVPNTEFSWIGTPLVSQCLGVLWLGSIMYPEHYANINIAEKARQFYSLFVHFEESEDYYNNFLADRKIKL